MSTHDKHILEKSKEHLIQEEGHFSVRIPFNEKKNQLHGNVELARTRLQSLQNRFKRDKQLQEDYEAIITDHEEKGYIRRLTEKENEVTKWWLPHFPVINRMKDTTKVRIVFDAAAKSWGNSLNDAIEIGPKLQGDLIKILLRFRRYSVALACDISEMYLQIRIDKEDRPWLRFLWQTKEGKEYVFEFERLVFVFEEDGTEGDGHSQGRFIGLEGLGTSVVIGISSPSFSPLSFPPPSIQPFSI